jgi:hypothetical protein
MRSRFIRNKPSTTTPKARALDGFPRALIRVGTALITAPHLLFFPLLLLGVVAGAQLAHIHLTQWLANITPTADPPLAIELATLFVSASPLIVVLLTIPVFYVQPAIALAVYALSSKNRVATDQIQMPSPWDAISITAIFCLKNFLPVVLLFGVFFYVQDRPDTAHKIISELPVNSAVVLMSALLGIVYTYILRAIIIPALALSSGFSYSQAAATALSILLRRTGSFVLASIFCALFSYWSWSKVAKLSLADIPSDFQSYPAIAAVGLICWLSTAIVAFISNDTLNEMTIDHLNSLRATLKPETVEQKKSAIEEEKPLDPDEALRRPLKLTING